MIKYLHPQLKLTRTLTGRLATSGFPVLGLPKHSEEGRKIRGLVRAPKGFVIYEADYSQIEMRVAAELSQDQELIKVYREAGDLHAQTAYRCLNAPKDKKDQDESKHRLPAKTVNFSMLMGTSPRGLTESIHRALASRGYPLRWAHACPGCKSFKAEHLQDCDSVMMMKEWFRVYKGIKQFMDDRRERVLETGMAFGMWGLDWSLPGVWSPYEEVREQALRQSHALPVQEGAQRLIKKAMARIAPLCEDDIFPLLQIHDSLLFCVPEIVVESWHTTVKRIMENVVQWSIPIVADGKAGPSWLELEAL